MSLNEKRPNPFESAPPDRNSEAMLRRTLFSIRLYLHRTLRSPTLGIGTEFLDHREKIQMTRRDSTWTNLSGAGGRRNCPHTRAISAYQANKPGDRDSLAERGGFEPPVPRGLLWAEFGRVWGTIWPDQKHPRRREFVRLEFGSASALSGIRRRLVAQQLQLNFHSSIGPVHEDVAYRQPDRETWPSSHI